MGLLRKRTRLDKTPVTVDVEPGTLVFHDGKQRSGTVHNVPKHLAMQWLRYRYVTAVYEPQTGGEPASTPSFHAPFDGARAGHDGVLGAESVPAPDSPPPANDHHATAELAGAAHDGNVATDDDTEHDPSHGITAGQSCAVKGDGREPSSGWSAQPLRPVKNGLYDSQELAGYVCQVCQHCGSRLSSQASKGKRPRKWCSDACRLRAYRRRERA